MYQTSEQFGNLIQQDSRTFYALLYFDGNTITDGISEITIEGGSNSEDDFSIGSAVSRYAKIKMANPGKRIEGKEITVKIGMMVGDAVEYVPMGFFTAEKPKTDEGQITVTAYDRMMKTERPFSTDGLGKTTDTISVLNAVSRITGVVVVTDGLDKITMDRPDGYSCREILGYVSQMYGGFATCNRQGQIEIRTYIDSNYSVDTGRYWDTFEHHDVTESNLKNTIRAAEQIKTDLDTEVENATPIKQGLDDSNTAAGKTKTALDTSNTTATKTKADLDASNTTASETKTGLDATNKTAAGLVTSLGNKITEGTQVKTDIQTTGETAMSNLQAEATKQQEFIKTSIDDTLSISGKAADAAVTGKKIDSLKEDISNKITKFYASNQGETHITDSDNGKIQDMMLYGKSEQKQYKGINLFPPDTKRGEYIEVSIPKDSLVFWITDGTPTKGGNFRFFNEDKTKDMWFGVDSGTTSMRQILTIDAKYVQNLINTDFDLSKICLGIGSEPIYEPYTGGIPSPSPDYPQEIKSVVNPTVKVCGKNLWNPIAGGYINGSNGSITEHRKEHLAVTDFIKINGKDITVIARNFSSAIKDAFAYRVGLYNSEKKWIKNIPITDGNRYSISAYKTTDSEYIRVSAPSGIYDTIQIEYGSEATPYEPYTEQSVQLPYTLNAIPVTSGGNVTINGQQYIADYVDVERGKVVRMCERKTLNTKNGRIDEEYRLALDVDVKANDGSRECIFSTFRWTNWETCASGTKIYIKNIKKSKWRIIHRTRIKRVKS